MDEQEYRERLARDAARWRTEGIITGEQERAILARTGTGSAARTGIGSASAVRALRLGWLITAVSVIGALVLGAGVVLFFASHWEKIPDFTRMAMLFAGLVAVYGVGYVLIEKLDMQRLGSAFLLLGGVLFQASLFLVAQIYNMPVESPVLFLLGAIGAFPLAYLFGSRIVLLLALAAITTWRIWAASLELDDGAEEWATLVLVGAFGVLLYGIGRLHMVRPGILNRLGEVYVFLGALITLGIVYCATFTNLWDEFIREGVESYSAPTAVYVAIGIAVAAVAAQLVLRVRTTLDLADVAAQLGLLVLAFIVATWPAWTGYAVVFNGVFFALAGAIIAYGYLTDHDRYVNGGLIAIAVGLISRFYDDTFRDGEGGAALALVGAFGVLLYGIGRLRMVRAGILNRRGEVYVFLGALLTLGIVYCATFPDLWDEFIREGVESYSAPAAVYLAIGMAITAVAAQLVLRARTTLDLGDVAVQLGLLVLAFIVATWPAWTGYAVVFNGVFFALAGAIIAYGYLTGDDRYVNGGLIAIAVGLLTRYVDVFWSLLVNSAFFIVGGALLLALAFVLERARRAILADMNGPDDDGPFPQQEALE